jgi:predicted lipid-binding transport protein (Tim44 family)
VDGDDKALLEVATPEAVGELLYEGDASKNTRVVVRGPRVRAIRILEVDMSKEPATMRIEVQLGGRRYVEDRDTAAVVRGSKDHATTFTKKWSLALVGKTTNPWHLLR